MFLKTKTGRFTAAASAAAAAVHDVNKKKHNT